MRTNSTDSLKVPDFPLSAPNQGPADDLAHLTGLLRVLSYMLEEGTARGITGRVAADLLALMCDVLVGLAPLQLFLDELEDTQPLYGDCRRLAILQQGGKAVAL